MVKRLTFSTFLFLSLQQLVSSSTSANASGTLAQVGSGYQLMNVESASSDLPQPPVASTDRLPETIVLRQRIPINLKNYNANTPRTEIQNIPSGLELYYENILVEMVRHNPAHRATLMTFLEIIINDRVDQFIAFEPTFKKVFGTDYKNFTSADRTVLGLLVTFGSSEILATYDFKGFGIDDAELDPSIKFLVEHHLLSFVAHFVSTAAPFLVTAELPLEHSLLCYVMNKPGCDQLSNLTVFFAELSRVDANYIAALIPLLPNKGKSNTMTELLTVVHDITNSIRNSNVISKTPFMRERAIKNMKNALHEFFSLCLTDFASIGLGDRFTIAQIFIEAGNTAALERLLDAQPGMVETLANEKSLLQICIDSNAFFCSRIVARDNPALIFGVYNGVQSPFFQSIIYGSESYFELFFPRLKSNEILPVAGYEAGLSPIAMAMVIGNADFLAEIVNHFDQNRIPYNIRACFESAFDYLNTNYVQAKPTIPRATTLLSHSLWRYILDFLGIHNERTDPQKLTLLDYAVIDLNPEAARLIIERFGPHIVNDRQTAGTLQGNCLRFYNNDLNMLKLLVYHNIDVNTPITKVIVNEGQVSSVEYVPVLSQLLAVFDEESMAYIKTLNFSEETLRDCHAYAKSKSFGTTMALCAELLQTKHGVTI